jgi:hypothetical protein
MSASKFGQISSFSQEFDRNSQGSYITDDITATVVHLAARLNKLSCLKDRRVAARPNLLTLSPKQTALKLSACSAMKASTRKKPSAGSTNLCNALQSSLDRDRDRLNGRR